MAQLFVQILAFSNFVRSDFGHSLYSVLKLELFNLKKLLKNLFFIFFLGDVLEIDDAAVIVLSIPQYSRYRAVLKRIAGKEKQL